MVTCFYFWQFSKIGEFFEWLTGEISEGSQKATSFLYETAFRVIMPQMLWIVLKLDFIIFTIQCFDVGKAIYDV